MKRKPIEPINLSSKHDPEVGVMDNKPAMLNGVLHIPADQFGMGLGGDGKIAIGVSRGPAGIYAAIGTGAVRILIQQLTSMCDDIEGQAHDAAVDALNRAAKGGGA